MTAASPLVSIIIPCFNYGRFLGEAIDSALGQTYQPVEVIVVDDGSADNTLEVARSYPVAVIAQPNRGVCAAGNAGFAAASGEFIMRLDADDRLAPTYVEATLGALRNDPLASFAYTQCRYFGARTGTYPVEPFDPQTLAERNYINASALMRRDALMRVGGYNANMLAGRYEDWDLWLRFADHGMRGVLVPKPLLNYRQHPSPTRGTLQLGSIRALRREAVVAAQLQANHPDLFRRTRLVRRLGRVPRRMMRGEVSVRFAVLLLGFYGVMLVRSLFPRSRASQQREDWLGSCKIPSVGGSSS